MNERIVTEQKVWGTAMHVFNSNFVAISILQTIAGGYCSRHSHKQRINRFIVQSGAIDVVEYDASGENEISRIRMIAGDVHDVETEVVHRFEVVSSGVVVELYFPTCPGGTISSDDIDRIDVGGMNKIRMKTVEDLWK